MKLLAIYTAAAIAEIAGCFSFWAWLRLDRSPLWTVPGMASLALFAWLLTLSDANAAGRAYAIYGGIYIASSLLWLWAIEQVRPDRWDLIGASICLIGAAVMFATPPISAFVQVSDLTDWSPVEPKRDPSSKLKVQAQPRTPKNPI